jgi:hypothetical protein
VSRACLCCVVAMAETESSHPSEKQDRIVLNTTADDRTVIDNCMRMGGHTSKADMTRVAIRCYQAFLAERQQIVRAIEPKAGA